MILKLHLHKKQGLIYKARKDYRFRVLVTGRRFGKTILAVVELIIAALSKPNALLWYIAPFRNQAKDITWRIFKQVIPDGAVKYNESELKIFFPNGSEVAIKGADKEEGLRGSGLDGLIIDEFASIYDNWSVYHEVLRPALADKKGWVMFIGTPKGKDALYELWLKGQRREDGWISWNFKTIDNPFIDIKEIEQERKTCPERYFRQEYEASFEDFVGLIYPEFKESHIIKPFEIPSNWHKLCVIDPAVSGKTGALFGAIDEHENVYIFNEYYEKDKRVSEVVYELQQTKVNSYFIDPASQARTHTKEGKLYSLYDEYSDYGIHPRTGENDVEAGINRVGEYFKTDRIKVFNNCTNLIWELNRYHWAKQPESIKGEAQPKPFKKDDHLCDCLRYMIMTRPKGPEIPIERPQEFSLEAILQRDRQYQEASFA